MALFIAEIFGHFASLNCPVQNLKRQARELGFKLVDIEPDAAVVSTERARHFNLYDFRFIRAVYVGIDLSANWTAL